MALNRYKPWELIPESTGDSEYEDEYDWGTFVRKAKRADEVQMCWKSLPRTSNRFRSSIVIVLVLVFCQCRAGHPFRSAHSALPALRPNSLQVRLDATDLAIQSVDMVNKLRVLQSRTANGRILDRQHKRRLHGAEAGCLHPGK